VDALAVLREDHLKVLAILDDLERAPEDGRPVTPDQLAARRQLVTTVVMAESAHEALEEEYFWPSVRHWLPEGKELATPAMEQEQAAKQLLAELDKLDAGEPAFERLVAQVVADAREHIRYEETQVWPVVRDRLAESELDELGRKMAAARKVAPTRPHPRTPARPGVLKTVGMAAATMDRIRDVATRRHASTVVPLRRGADPGPRMTAGTAENTPGGATPADRTSEGTAGLSRPLRAVVAVLTLALVVLAVRRRRAARSDAGAATGAAGAS
jgi:hemerythrin-like domain-containing protein